VSKAAKRERQRVNREARRQAELQAQRRSRMLKTLRNGALLLVPLAILFIVLQVIRDDGNSSADDDNEIKRTYSNPPPLTIDTAATYTATIETTEGTMVVNLDAAAAPESVNNFVFLSKKDFYNGLEVTRVAKDFVIQTGSPENTQSGGPGYTVQGEVPQVAAGEPAYPVGTVAFAKSGQEPAGTAGSQFFIVFGDGQPQLPADYALIGQVTEGIKVAKTIGKLYPRSGMNDGPPTETVTVDSVTIEKS
jgi:cyclophilin family peptidyl-prolyl cis-trans isomerase